MKNFKKENFKNKIARSFDKSARIYDKYSSIQKEASIDLINFLRDSEDVSLMSTCLDIGAGTGNTSLYLKGVSPGIDFTLCDISSSMLEVAREKIGDCETLNIDAESYNFGKCYDICVSNLAMQWFRDLDNFFMNISKICRVFAFSLLLNTSFREYKDLFRNPPTFDYPSYDDLGLIMDRFKNSRYFNKRYIEKYDSPLGVARHFKNIGAGIASGGSDEGIGIREDIIGVLRSKIGCINLNYDVFFGLIITEGV